MGIRRAVCTVCTVVLVWCGGVGVGLPGGRAALEFKSKTSSRVEENKHPQMSYAARPKACFWGNPIRK